MTEKPIPTWITQRQEEQDIEAEERSNYFKLSYGETPIEIDITEPVKKVNKFNKTRYQYKLTNGKTLEVGIQLDTLIINALMSHVNPMIVIKAGKGINTSYSIKGIE